MAWVEERRRKRKARKSLFDVEPTEEQLALEELQKAALASHGPNPNVFLRPEERAPVASLETTASLQSQHTRHARRLYIGQISPDLSDRDIHDFFRDAVYRAMGIMDPKPDDDPVLSVYTNRERHFAFVEFTSIEITTACLALNGIDMLNRGRIIVKRPNDYNAAAAPPANADFMKKFDVSKLGIVSNIVPDSPHKIFIGGLPYHLNDEQVMELLSAFGKIRAFHLVKSDSTAITSKGYCFVEYADENVRDIAIMGLNGMDMGGGKVLTAKIASERAEGEGVETGTAAVAGPLISTPAVSSIVDVMSLPSLPSTAPPIMRIVDGVDVEALVDFAMGNSGSHVSSMTVDRVPSRPLNDPSLANAIQNMPVNGSSLQSRILVLHNMVTDADFETVEDYESLKEEVKEECQKFGTLVSIKIPHPQVSIAVSSILLSIDQGMEMVS
jgi:splicing factor U2AF subunit